MKTHLRSDIWLYRIVVAVLGLTAVTSITGAIVLALSGQFTPEVPSSAATAGLLSPCP